MMAESAFRNTSLLLLFFIWGPGNEMDHNRDANHRILREGRSSGPTDTNPIGEERQWASVKVYYIEQERLWRERSSTNTMRGDIIHW